MSRLVDKLTSNIRTAAPLGFQARQVGRSQPKLLLVASLTVADFDRLAGDLAGADAALLKASGVDDIKNVVQKAPELPWGAWPGSPDGEALAELAAAGIDFVLFSADSPAGGLPKDGEVGQVLEVGDILDESWLRAVNKLPVDAVLVGGEEDGLTWHRLMRLQYCVDLLSKPVLAMVPSGVVESELAALLEAGVGGVVVPVAAGQPAGRLAELRKVIDGLEPPATRRKDKAMALLPRVNSGAEGEIEEPGEPDDE